MKVLERERKVFSEEELQKLVIAGRLMQSGQWPNGPVKIKVAEGQTYADAVQDAAQALSPQLRTQLREWVRWVYEYETTDAPGSPPG